MTRDLQWLLHAQTVSAAAAVNSSISGPSGVKMSGPYSWVLPSQHAARARLSQPLQVPPSYFHLDDGRYALGGGWGFLTEGGPGESPMSASALQVVRVCQCLLFVAALPQTSSLIASQRTVDREQLWPPLPDDCWGHCGSQLGLFGSLKRFNGPLTARCLSLSQPLFCSNLRLQVRCTDVPL